MAKDIWDKLQVLAALVASVLIPVALALVGHAYGSAQKESENRVKYVEIAVSILRSEPTPDTSALRNWAVEVIAKQSAVTLPVAAQQEMTRGRVFTFPSGDSGTLFGNYNGGVVSGSIGGYDCVLREPGQASQSRSK